MYAYSWYLNTVCQNWAALVEGDYESVMPLPLTRRFGLQGIKTPVFVNQLGIFSSKLITHEKIKEFVNAVPSRILFIELNFNKFNKVKWKGLHILKKSHYELDLIKPYEKISRLYDKNLKERLSGARKFKLSVIKGIAPNDLFRLIVVWLNEKVMIRREDKSKMLKLLVSTSLRHQFGELFGVYDAFNTLCCVAFFVWSESRAILLYSYTSPEGIRENAFQFLVDHFIQINSGRFVTLSFDYAETDEFIDTYRHFGAIASEYQTIIKNRLPFASKLFNDRYA